MPNLVPPEDDESENNEPEKKQQKPPLAQLCHSMCPQKPSWLIRELHAGAGINPTRSTTPQTIPSRPMPGSLVKEAKEAGGVWVVVNGEPSLIEDFEGLEYTFMAETSDSEALEPCTLAEAKHRPKWLQWKKVIEEELATLEAAGTWMLEEPPPEANIIGSKWVFKAKKDAAGIIAHLKARLVMQGFSQIGGVNYDDTYTPVAWLASSRAIISMASCLGFKLHQVNIKDAYLNSELNEDKVLYMQFPPGYKPHDAGNCMLHLKKTLYGLKQSGQRRYQKLSSIFESLGF